MTDVKVNVLLKAAEMQTYIFLLPPFALPPIQRCPKGGPDKPVGPRLS